MSDMRPSGSEIELGGRKLRLLWTINVIDQIQDRYDMPISEIDQLFQDERKAIKAIRELLTMLINEAILDSESGEPPVDEMWVGRKLTVNNIRGLKSMIMRSFSDGLPDGDGDPNAESEQPKN